MPLGLVSHNAQTIQNTERSKLPSLFALGGRRRRKRRRARLLPLSRFLFLPVLRAARWMDLSCRPFEKEGCVRGLPNTWCCTTKDQLLAAMNSRDHVLCTCKFCANSMCWGGAVVPCFPTPPVFPALPRARNGQSQSCSCPKTDGKRRKARAAKKSRQLGSRRKFFLVERK